jgi:hypothetical protein
MKGLKRHGAPTDQGCAIGNGARGFHPYMMYTERSNKMEAQEKWIRSTTNESAQKEAVACSKCGQLLKHPHEWVRGENGTIICATCYQEILFPNVNYHSMEAFD